MKVSILGTGAYGLALALILNENKNEVKMWTRYKEEADYLNMTRMSDKLKGVYIDEEISISSNLEETIKDSELIVIAVPAGAVDGDDGRAVHILIGVIVRIVPYQRRCHSELHFAFALILCARCDFTSREGNRQVINMICFIKCF